MSHPVHTGALSADFDGSAGPAVATPRVRRGVHQVGGVRSQTTHDHFRRVGVGDVARGCRVGGGRVGSVDADVGPVAADDARRQMRGGRAVVVGSGVVRRSPLDTDRRRIDHFGSDASRLAGN